MRDMFSGAYWSSPIPAGDGEDWRVAWTLRRMYHGETKYYYGTLYKTETGYTVRSAFKIGNLAYFDPMMSEQEAKDTAKVLLIANYEERSS